MGEDDVAFRIVLLRPDGDRDVWHVIGVGEAGAKEAAEEIRLDPEHGYPPGTRIESVARDHDEEARLERFRAEEDFGGEDDEVGDRSW